MFVQFGLGLLDAHQLHFVLIRQGRIQAFECVKLCRQLASLDGHPFLLLSQILRLRFPHKFLHFFLQQNVRLSLLPILVIEAIDHIAVLL